MYAYVFYMSMYCIYQYSTDYTIPTVKLEKITLTKFEKGYNLCSKSKDAKSRKCLHPVSQTLPTQRHCMMLILKVVLLFHVLSTATAFSAFQESSILENTAKAERENVGVSDTVTPTSYLQINSYDENGSCDSDVYNIWYIALGVCGPLVPDNPLFLADHHCGGFVKASALPATKNGEAGLKVTYAYFSDHVCSIVAAEKSCTESIFVSTHRSATSANKPAKGPSIGFLTSTVTIPSTGYHTR